MKTAKANSGKLLEEALELINEAAKEKGDELYKVINAKYSGIKELLSEKADEGREAISFAKLKLLKTLEDEEARLIKRAKAVDKKIHRNPWPVLGGVALGSVVLGMRLRKNKNASPEKNAETE